MSTKEFNKYTIDELKTQLDQFRALRKLAEEVETASIADPEKLFTKLSPPYFWSKVYSHPYVTHISFLIEVLDLTELVHEAAECSDPTSFMQSRFDMEPSSEWNGGPEGKYEEKFLFGLIYSLGRTIHCMEVFGKFINELVADMQNGNDKAIFKAVQIDRSVTSCPAVADRITKAQILRDEDFFNRLGRALATSPRKVKDSYNDLRFMLYALEEAGALNGLSIERAYWLFCEVLEVYPADGNDPAKSLNQFILRWKKVRST